MKTKLYTLLFALMSLSLFACNAQSGGEKLAPKEFSEKLSASSGAILLDVRTPAEYSEGFIKGALNVDFKSQDFESQVKALDKEKTYFVYCRSGGRSGNAVSTMKSLGFKNIYDLSGGIMAWQEAKMPLEKK